MAIEQNSENNGYTNQGLELDEVKISPPAPPVSANKKVKMHKRQNAILIRNAYKKYGDNKVIDNLNMTVKEGTIYALLGSSGCGKTTLLLSALGIKKLDDGKVEIFGYEPNTADSGVPGSRIGYMCQETGLSGEFTIKEALYYFGRIFGMPAEKIEQRMHFLIDLFKTPKEDRLIRTCSIGQQRRISFIATLLHEPQLLILDEPTVAVDPILRQCIWDHLKELIEKNQTTIIITTHNIEESNNANTIGIMRRGKLLVEDSPENLKETYNAPLEEVFLQVSLQDEKASTSTTTTVAGIVQKKNSTKVNKNVPWVDNNTGPVKRLRALIIRNYIRMYRNILFLLFLIFYPTLAVVVISVAIGGEIHGLNFGYVNFETNATCAHYPNIDCEMVNDLGCQFLSILPRTTFNQKYIINEEEAIQATKRGEIWGFIKIEQTFSDTLRGVNTDIDEYNGPGIEYNLDVTNQQIGLISKSEIAVNYEKFYQIWHQFCGNPSQISETIRENDPIYGEKDTKFRDFILPSFHLVMIIFMAVTLTGLVLIVEKKSGMYERTLVCGVTKNEIVLSHFVCQYGVTVFQIFFSLLIIFVGYDLPAKGSLLGVILISLLIGTIGILFGFVASILANEEGSVLQLAVILIMPQFLLSGVVWPLEGLPDWLYYVSIICIPCTLPNESIRSMMLRDWGIFHASVWPGFLSGTLWVGALCLLIFLLNKYNVNTAK